MLVKNSCGGSSLQSRRSAATKDIHASPRPLPRATGCMHVQIANWPVKQSRIFFRSIRRLRACASASLGQQEPSRRDGYTPYSAELLLAVARLGHLERYREEVRLFYEPGAPTDLTRCGLLVSNIFNPQLDHRPYYTRLEDLAATAALRAVDAVMTNSSTTCLTAVDPASSSCNSQGLPGRGSLTHQPDSLAPQADDGLAAHLDITVHRQGRAAVPNTCFALDPDNPQHLLCAISAINDVLFVDEGLSVNHLDLYDPLNGSIADVLDRRVGNQYSLAIVYLHVASALGLTCGLVGSAHHVLVRIGDPYHTGSQPAAFMVDVSSGGQVYSWKSSSSSSSSDVYRDSGCRSPQHPAAAAGEVEGLCPEDQADSTDQQWHRELHTWLRQQQQHNNLDDSQSYTLNLGQHSDTHSIRSFAYEEDSMMGGSDTSSIDSFNLAEDQDGLMEVSGWNGVAGYAAVDSANRNSWKTLYGPGALTEWGGLVDSSNSTSAGIDGRDTCCSLNTVEHMDADGVSLMDSDESSGSADSLHDVTLHRPPAVAHGVVQLSDADVAQKYGDLQPVSSRELLQQMLCGMKLSLLMSGRDVEALSVVRYLRSTDPFGLPDLRDEALLLAHQQQHEQAAALLREYLAVAPGAVDAEMVREVLEQQMLAAQLARNRAKRQQQ